VVADGRRVSRFRKSRCLWFAYTGSACPGEGSRGQRFNVFCASAMERTTNFTGNPSEMSFHAWLGHSALLWEGHGVHFQEMRKLSDHIHIVSQRGVVPLANLLWSIVTEMFCGRSGRCLVLRR
jgi:hypothetical protein